MLIIFFQCWNYQWRDVDRLERYAPLMQSVLEITLVNAYLVIIEEMNNVVGDVVFFENYENEWMGSLLNQQ